MERVLEESKHVYFVVGLHKVDEGALNWALESWLPRSPRVGDSIDNHRSFHQVVIAVGYRTVLLDRKDGNENREGSTSKLEFKLEAGETRWCLLTY